MDLIESLCRWSGKFSFERPEASCQTCGDLAWNAEGSCRTCGGALTDLDIVTEEGWEPPY
ncbi:hypothetical protein OB955_22250 [Halobacteria archaeon AArc-m2/3/4]|uniref:Uncharacterized protein n=1 Tax=Natronoglomus mannanivorans TaxID=2979990 RepID=A0AAP3E1J9_9EURY|nr:hypothetical protein [Halobacteria archaeon AArc-xg1-1]MCU4975417.1 hypothetical protein [Halobacteria archaeon AArc-m2/3/4]